MKKIILRQVDEAVKDREVLLKEDEIAKIEITFLKSEDAVYSVKGSHKDLVQMLINVLNTKGAAEHLTGLLEDAIGPEEEDEEDFKVFFDRYKSLNQRRDIN